MLLLLATMPLVVSARRSDYVNFSLQQLAEEMTSLSLHKSHYCRASEVQQIAIPSPPL